MAKVGIRVYPNTSRFRGDLKRALDRVEKSTAAKVTVVPVLDWKAMGRLQHALNGLTTTVSVDANIQKAMNQLDGLSAEKIAKISAEADVGQAKRALKNLEEARKCTVNADADTGAASAKLGALARPRVAVINPVVNASAAAAATSTLATLSGGRVLGDAVSGVKNFAANLDRLTPRIAATSAGLASLSAVGLVSAQNLVTVGASLASIGTAALALPGIFAGFATGLAASADGLQNVHLELGKFYGGEGKIMDTIAGVRLAFGRAFWDEARGGLAGFVENAFDPFLKQYVAFGPIAGKFWGEFFQGISNGMVAVGGMPALFEPLAASFQIASAGASSLAEGIVRIGSIGGQYLPTLAEHFTNASTAFAQWSRSADAEASIEGAIHIAGELGRVLSGLGGIIGAIGHAAADAGGSSLTALADGVHRVSDALHSVEGQNALVSIFESARRAVDNLSPAIGEIGRGLGTLAPSLGSAMENSAAAIGRLGEAIGKVMQNPVVGSGIEAMFRGVKQAVDALAPGLEALAPVFGALGPAIGAIASTLGSVFGAALQAVAPLLQVVLQAVAPLAQMLGQVLTSAVQALAPVFAQFAVALAPVAQSLVPALSAVFQALVPVFAQLATALAPVAQSLAPMLMAAVQALAPVFVQFATSLVPVVQSLVPALMSAFQALAPVFVQVAAALIPVVQALIPALMAVFQALAPVIVQVVQALGPLVVLFAEQLVKTLNFVTPLIQALGPVFVDIGSEIVSAIQMITGILQWMADMTDKSLASFGAIWQVATQAVGAAVNWIVTSVGNLIGAIGSTIGNIVQTVSAGWNAAVRFVAAGVQSVWNAVSGVFSRLAGIAGNAMGAVGNAISTGIQQAVGFFGDLGRGIIDSISNLGRNMWTLGRNLMVGFINGVSGLGRKLIDAVLGPVSGAIDGAKKLLGIHSPSRVFRQIGVFTGEGFVQGISAMESAAQSSMRDLVAPPEVPAIVSVAASTASIVPVAPAGISGAGGSVSASDEALVQIAEALSQLQAVGPRDFLMMQRRAERMV